MLAGSQEGEVGATIIESVQQHLRHLTLLVQHKPEIKDFCKLFWTVELERATGLV